MKEYKFRAWIKQTINNRFNYSYAKAEEKYSQIEPSKYSDEWDEWYEAKDLYRTCLSSNWNAIFPQEEMYTETYKMTDDIKVNITVLRPFNCEIIDIMQYAGLEDYFGKEVFMGDIVSVTDTYNNNHKFYGVVEFDNASFMINQGDTCKHYRWIDYSFVVLGNVHENPELIEKLFEDFDSYKTGIL